MPEITRRSLRARVDKLLDSYESKGPDSGKRVAFNIGPRQLADEMGFDLIDADQREFVYRGRTLVAIGEDSVPAPHQLNLF